MVATLSLILFSLIFGIAVLAGRHYWVGPQAIVDRLRERAEPSPSVIRAPSRSWKDIPRFLGQRLSGGRGVEQRRQEFVMAGIRSKHAEATFKGLRVLGLFGLAILFAAIMAARESESGTIGMAAAAGAVCGFLLPPEILRTRIKRRRRRIERSLPNALDLLTIGVEAGLGLDQAIAHVSDQLAGPYPDIASEFSMINYETRAGKRRADAMRGMAERTGVMEVKKFVAVLIQADRFGTSIAQSLRSHSEHLRVQAAQKVEEKAAKLGVKMVFPIFFFILPSLFVMTVGPMLARIFQDLLPLMNAL
jgi:tight adherence protein C